MSSEYMSLKSRKESFVSHHSGSSIPEINLITSLALLSYILFKYLDRNTPLFHKEKRWSLASLMIDWLLQWGVLLAGVTVYSGRTLWLMGGIVAPVLMLGLIYHEQDQEGKNKNQKKKNNSNKKEQISTVKQFLPHKQSLTAYRSSMLIITAIAILAVDFPIFPRSFAKVETWGTSLMDLGVGSFVFSMGVVTTRSLLLDKFQDQIKKNYGSRVLDALIGTASCLVLGVIRMLAVKGLEYQEHVTEYGVHWNFFITLVLVGPITIIISPIFEYVPRMVIAVLIGFVYEMFLCHKDGLLPFLLLGERIDLISMNKEGIFSLIGYVAIFIAGQGVGSFLLPSVATPYNLFFITKPVPNQTIKRSKFEKLTTVSSSSGLLISFLFYGVLALVSVQTNLAGKLPVSRRLANLPYILWVCAYNTGSLLCFFMVDSLFNAQDGDDFNESNSVSLQAVNKNGMFAFLVANLSTGIVNMTFNTLDCGNAVAMMILTGYCLFVWAVCALMLKNNWIIKI